MSSLYGHKPKENGERKGKVEQNKKTERDREKEMSLPPTSALQETTVQETKPREKSVYPTTPTHTILIPTLPFREMINRKELCACSQPSHVDTIPITAS